MKYIVVKLSSLASKGSSVGPCHVLNSFAKLSDAEEWAEMMARKHPESYYMLFEYHSKVRTVISRPQWLVGEDEHETPT